MKYYLFLIEKNTRQDPSKITHKTLKIMNGPISCNPFYTLNIYVKFHCSSGLLCRSC